MPRYTLTELENDFTTDERFIQIFRIAQAKTDRIERRKKAFKLTAFWFGVIAICLTIVFVKLYGMGAVVGLK